MIESACLIDHPPKFGAQAADSIRQLIWRWSSSCVASLIVEEPMATVKLAASVGSLFHGSRFASACETAMIR